MTTLWPFLVIGLFSGAVYALAAMGLVLTYRTSGVFDFAFGAVAMTCAFVFWQLQQGWHLHLWVSLPAVLLVVAPAAGLAFERILRPLFAAPAEVQIVVSLCLLGFLEALVPLVFGGQARSLPGLFPAGTFAMGGLRISWNQLGTLAVAVLAGAGVGLSLRRTRFGLDARAAVDAPDLAELAGVRTATVTRGAWVLSTAFAALAGILLSSSQGLNTYVLIVVVIAGFAPAVLARLASLPVAFAGGILLGVAQGLLGRYGAAGIVADLEAALPYLALFLLPIAFGRKLQSRTRPPVPIQRGRRPARSPVGVLRLGLPAVGAAAVFPLVAGAPLVGDATYGLVVAAVALTLVVLTGWAGQISLAQFSFVGVGSVVAGHLAGAHGQWFLPAMVLGGLAAVPIGVVVGLPSLRLSGLFLALATLAFALVMDDLFFASPAVSGGYTGMTVPRPSVAGLSLGSTTSFYYLCLAVLVVFAGACLAIRAGALGRRLDALRETPEAAPTLGINVVSTKLAVFALCAFGAGVAGALYGALRQTVAPADFSFSSSLELLLLLVIGGRNLISGALAAGALYAVELLPSTGATGRYLPLAVAAIGVVVARNPDGLVAVAGRVLSWLGPVVRPLPRGEATPAVTP